MLLLTSVPPDFKSASTLFGADAVAVQLSALLPLHGLSERKSSGPGFFFAGVTGSSCALQDSQVGTRSPPIPTASVYCSDFVVPLLKRLSTGLRLSGLREALN